MLSTAIILEKSNPGFKPNCGKRIGFAAANPWSTEDDNKQILLVLYESNDTVFYQIELLLTNYPLINFRVVRAASL